MIRHALAVLLVTVGIPTAPAQQAADPSPAMDGEQALEAMPLEAGTDALTSTADDRLSLQVRVPVDGPALVVDQREVALLAGRNRIRIRDLPRTLRDLSLHWHLNGPAEPTRVSRISRDASTWEADLFVEAGGSRRLTLTYLVDGLNRGLDYRMAVPAGAQGAGARLTAAVTLENRTGADLGNADLSVALNGDSMARLQAQGPWPSDTLLRIRPEPPTRIDVKQSLITQARGDLPAESPWRTDVQYLLELQGLEHPPGPDTPVTLVTADNPPRPLGEGRFATTIGGRPAVIGGGSNAVTVRRVQAAYRDGGEEEIDIAWRIELHNRDRVAHRITLIERIDGGWTIEEGEDDWQRTPVGLSRQVNLAAGERREVGYRIQLFR
ncbi:hypothetical protein [Spiribacter onubensis]|uniref:DUF4139 domain-containing protein n=1 Tax=Spiribacter onubensis TaxID=3122420 RepID=A0ABV3SA99_9GAMM